MDFVNMKTVEWRVYETNLPIAAHTDKKIAAWQRSNIRSTDIGPKR